MALQVPSIQSSVGALNKILKEGSASERREAIINHIQKTENDSRFDIPVNFPPNCSWFNTSDGQTLSFSADLKGRLVILDFFTYCCINCIHILPDLHRLEQEYQDKGVTIIGVHSAKFPNERNSTNILNAILRYGITHPVINDADIKLWDDMGISCWPTLLIVSPEGRVLHQIIGEGHYMELESFVQVAVEYYESKGSLSDVPLGLTLERDKCSGSFLSFPGKIAANLSTRDMYISDSSNHRVLVVDRSTGLVKRVYGSGSPGLLDGRGQKAEFNSPQGLAFSDGLLYVADTENHSIRQVDLCSHEVLTVVGTGVQGDDKVGGKIGKEQEISSPWDLCFNHDSSILYIAMAGTHQIWAYLLKDMEFLKNK
jgi:thiol-disulfide isomerase/thioredoxin